jgi:hypothetical protein
MLSILPHELCICVRRSLTMLMNIGGSHYPIKEEKKHKVKRFETYFFDKV